MSLWKDESALPLPFISSVLLGLCSLSVCFPFAIKKRGLKLTTKKEKSVGWSIFCIIWDELTPQSNAIFYIAVRLIIFPTVHLYSLACPSSWREWIKKINFYDLISSTCKINPCSFISLYLDQYQIKYFWKMEKMTKIVCAR